MNYQPRTVDLLSFLYTLGYFSVLGLAFFRPFPEENRDVLNVLLGILSMVMVKIVEAYFNKDSANSATATAIRAMNSGPSNDTIKANNVDIAANTATVTETQPKGTT
jgi:hypothetical protein